ncbi:MAG: dienelactone hydrolase family protein [Chloroflexi bacterium]|nr:dienelactone hydrolase family protein [Chloroflexota bacterium]
MATQEELKIPFGKTNIPVSLALPESGTAPWPGVIVIHEMLGLNADIRRITRRFADSGYAAVAPDLFAGLGPKPICMMRTVAAYRSGGGRALKAIEASRSWLAERSEVDASRIGVAGFCMGGGFALLMGTTSTIGVTATFYGDVPDRAEDLAGVCPVIGSYGGRDRLFAKRGRRLKRFLDELGVSNDVKVYDGAGHSFMSHHSGLTARLGALSPLHAGYNESAAEDAWPRMLSFFAEHLGQASGN